MRNNIQKEARAEEINKQKNDIATNEKINLKHDYQFFKAIKYVRNPHAKQNERQYAIVKQHFQKQFYDVSKINTERFIGNPKPLNNI